MRRSAGGWLAAMFLALVLPWSAASAQTTSGSGRNGDYCEHGRRLTLFLIDQTTRYDRQDQELLVEGLSRFERTLELGERLVIATINDGPTGSTLLFDRCHPGCPEVGFPMNLIASCKPVVARRDRALFRAEFVKILRDVLQEPAEYPHSAILETIRARASEFLREPADRLVVFSDLLQNTDDHAWPSFARGRVLPRLRQEGLLADLHGAEVIAFGLGRDHAPGRPPLAPDELRQLVTFWETWFTAGGADPVRVGIAYPID